MLMPFEPLHDALMDLSASGASGFEGLVRNLLADVTGQPFRLMKSGAQGGIDISGDATGSGLVIGLEAKRYKPDTALALDALKSKLRDAALSFPAMDIWMVAATRAISGGDVRELEAAGANLGVDVLVLDWDSGTLLPRLALLCAAARARTLAALGNDQALVQALDEIVADPAYGPALAELQSRLTSPLVGYGSARPTMRKWLQRHMGDLGSARKAFDSHANLLDPAATRIGRPGAEAAFAAWWVNPENPLAVLGEEGVGKTWALLAWWLDIAETDPDAPLAFIIPARDVRDTDGPQLLAATLLAVSGLRDIAFWQRRVARWLTADVDRPLFLVILDGLNQNWTFRDWSDLILTLSVQEWQGRAAIALSCRPDHWSKQLKSLGDLPRAPSQLPISAFEAGELDAILAQHGLARRDFEPALLKLMEVPRLCRIAIARRAELAASGDITADRLVYEDWRHRSHHAQRQLSDAEFRTFLAALGREIRDNPENASFTRAEFYERFDEGSGQPAQTYEGVFSEVVDGGWLVPAGGRNRFRLKEGQLRHVLGLALVDELRGIDEAAEAVARIDEVLEPYRGADVTVRILRSASAFALLDPHSTRTVQIALIRAWIGSQNFRPSDFDAYWRSIAWAPEVFLDIAEALWFGPRRSGREDETLAKGFSNAWRVTETARAVEERLVGWFSRYWLDHRVGEVIGAVPDDAWAAARRSAAGERAKLWEGEAEEVPDAPTLTLVAPEQQAWGSYRAVEMLSWLPRAPLVRVFVAWALTRAILGAHRQQEMMAWVLRWNERDPDDADVALLAAAEQLLGCGPIAIEAGRQLLAALASPRARALLDAFDGDAETEEKPAEPAHRDFAEWNIDEALAAPRCIETPLAATAAIEGEPVDPDCHLSPAHIERLHDLAGSLDEQAAAAQPGDDGGLDDATLVLARWAPELRAEIDRRALRAALVDPERQLDEPVLDLLRETIPILPTDQLEGWRTLAAAERATGRWDDRLQAAALAGLAASEQVDILAMRPAGAEIEQWVAQLMAPLDAAAFDRLGALMEHADPEALAFWLHFILLCDFDAMPAGWQGLAPLLGHEDSKVREAAMELAYRTEDELLAVLHEAGGWAFTKDMGGDEAVYGSLLLVAAPAAGTLDVSPRVCGQALGDLAERWPDHPAYLDAFADFVDAELDHLFNAKSRTYPRAIMTRTDGWAEMIERRPERVAAWSDLVGEAVEKHAAHLFFMAERFPLYEVVGAIEGWRPGAGATLLAHALGEMVGGPTRSGDLVVAVLKSDGEAGEKGRGLVLDIANDDEKLFDFAEGLQDCGRQDWLFALIEERLATTDVGEIARALTLAGFLDDCAPARALWEGALAAPPASGWLTDVWRASRDRFIRHGWAVRWLEEFKSGEDPVALTAHHAMLAAIADERITLDGYRPDAEGIAAWSWQKRMIWRRGWETIRTSFKSHRTARKALFLASKPPLSNQYPRRR